MNAAIIVFSDKGHALGERLFPYFAQNGNTAKLTRCASGGLFEWTKANFENDALIFIGSCGIAVRAVAPFLKSKTTDPAVIVIDELASFVVPLMSGHIGGANDFAGSLARFLKATPVLTTATDVNGVFSIDAWAAKNGLKIANPKRIKQVSSLLLAGKAIKIQCDFPVTGELPKGVLLCEEGGDVLITYLARGREEALLLVPPILTLGIGCKKGVAAETIKHAFELILKKTSCHPLAVARVCSIDLKMQEEGILEFCRMYSLPYKTFSANELIAVRGVYSASEFVKQVTGADNVCERSAVLGAGAGGRLITGKNAGNGVTMAIAISPYTVRFGEEEII